MNHIYAQPIDIHAQAWGMRFGLKGWAFFYLTDAIMVQLSRCRSDSARRLILGVSEKEGKR